MDEVKMPEPAEAQAQGGGEVVAVTRHDAGFPPGPLFDPDAWDRLRALPKGTRLYTAPPSAPVGAEEVVMAARNAENTIRNCAAAGQIGDGYVQYADDLRDAVQRLAQQPATCGTCREVIRPDALTGTTCKCAQKPAAPHLHSGDWPKGCQQSVEAAKAYIRDWCPDHVKDYIDSLAQQPAAVDGAK